MIRRTPQHPCRLDLGGRGGGRRMIMPGQPRRTRSWGLVVLAALLVIGTGLGVAAYGLSAGKKMSVLAVGESIAKGQVIERDDLITRVGRWGVRHDLCLREDVIRVYRDSDASLALDEAE